MKIVETVASSVTSTRQFVWTSSARAEERDGSGTLTKNFLSQGQRNGSTNLLYGKDHLGSVRELTNDSGIVQAAFCFDPYGRVAKTEGTGESDFGFAGYFVHARSGLNLVARRSFSSKLGRWLNRDPLGERGGLNLYGYVSNAPTYLTDPSGLKPCDPHKGRAREGGTGVTNYDWDSQGAPPKSDSSDNDRKLVDPFATTEPQPPSPDDWTFEDPKYTDGPTEYRPDLKTPMEVPPILWDQYWDYVHPNPPDWLFMPYLES